MTSPEFEAFLARVYVDPEFRAAFLADPRTAAHRAALSEAECDALATIDREGLEMAAASFASKRKKQRAGQKTSWFKKLVSRV